MSTIKLMQERAKDLARIVLEEVKVRVQEQLPQFQVKKSTRESVTYAWDFAPDLHFYLIFTTYTNMRGQMVGTGASVPYEKVALLVRCAWSHSDDVPDWRHFNFTTGPHSQPFGDGLHFRLERLWTEEGYEWVCSDNGEYKPINQQDYAQIRSQVDDALGKIRRYALPYFQALAQSSSKPENASSPDELGPRGHREWLSGTESGGETRLKSGINTVPLNGFASKAVTGSADCRVPIADLATWYEQLARAMETGGVRKAQLEGLVALALVGVCPDCLTTSAGPDLLAVWRSQKLGESFAGSVGAERLLSGLCRNSVCSTNDIHLFWRVGEDHEALQRLADVGVALESPISTNRFAQYLARSAVLLNQPDRIIQCPDCQGRGWTNNIEYNDKTARLAQVSRRCRTCNGEKRVSTHSASYFSYLDKEEESTRKRKCDDREATLILLAVSGAIVGLIFLFALLSR